MALLTLSIFLSIAYAGIMLIYLRGWQSLPEWRVPGHWKPAVRVSVVMAARNEAANIGACLQSILGGSYPAHLLEIIVVDDHSEDNTTLVVRNVQAKLSESASPQIALLHLADFTAPGEALNSSKKKALETGIARAAGELIAITDADCIAPPDWLRFMASVYEMRTPKIICAPAAFHRESNLFQRFQSLDFLGLIGISGAGIQLGFQRMGNGANLAYPKVVFEEIGGFAGNEHRASGDDMFLIQKVALRWPGEVFFLKNREATVLTKAEPDWPSFLQQRLRWGSKNAALPEWPVRLVLLTVLVFCCSIWLNFGIGAARRGDMVFVLLPVYQLLAKAAADYIFLRALCRFFKREDLLRWFVPSFVLHTLYIPLVGGASLFFGKYEWKGRKVA